MVLPKAGLTQYDWADRSKSAFVMLLSSNAKNPHLRQYPNIAGHGSETRSNRQKNKTYTTFNNLSV